MRVFTRLRARNGSGWRDYMASVWLQCAVHLFIYLLFIVNNRVSPKGSRPVQRCFPGYKNRHSTTKQNNKRTKPTIQCSYLKNSLEIGLASFLGSFAGASYSFWSVIIQLNSLHQCFCKYCITSTRLIDSLDHRHHSYVLSACINYNGA